MQTNRRCTRDDTLRDLTFGEKQIVQSCGDRMMEEFSKWEWREGGLEEYKKKNNPNNVVFEGGDYVPDGHTYVFNVANVFYVNYIPGIRRGCEQGVRFKVITCTCESCRQLYAYVQWKNWNHPVVLGPCFWTASDNPYAKDSKVGTLFHELTHLVGSHDYQSYNPAPFCVNQSYSRDLKIYRPKQEGEERGPKKSISHAQSLEYAFEMGLRILRDERQSQGEFNIL